jgi:hypothetical protein
MNHRIALLLILLFPGYVFAQDTTALKRQANLLAKAFIASDYNTIINHTYPNVLVQSGGREKMMNTIKKGVDQMKAQGVIFESVKIGSPGKIYKSGEELQCLIPEILTLKLNNGHLINHSYLLAITKDKGKKWYFLDLNKGTLPHLHAVVPNLNKEMVIPEVTQPTFLSN